MKNFILCFLLIAPLSAAFASNPDSLAYQLQRKKINGLLDARSQKFSQYIQSLDMHTGIFGLQTKKDIRRSNEILMDIARTDNVIFRELKILLDYKTFQQTTVLTKSHDTEDKVINYMVAINKLRQQNVQLRESQNELVTQNQKSEVRYIIAIIVLILTSIFLFFRNKRTSRA